MAVMDEVPGEHRLGVELARAENHLIRELIAVRLRRGLRRTEVAQRMGVNRSAVVDFESGGTNPTIATINDYAEAVGALIAYSVEEFGDV